jgi:GNAT superfamily N-acetyltransferase
MDLVLIEKHRGSDVSRFTWMPFDQRDGFEPTWWNRSHLYGDTYRHIEVRLADVEVARVELDETVHIDRYLGAPSLDEVALEIQFIEVSADHLRQGIASEVVRRLATAHPSRRLVAFSQRADKFWASLGWDRYDHQRGSKFYRPLFIQPDCQ